MMQKRIKQLALIAMFVSPLAVSPLVMAQALDQQQGGGNQPAPIALPDVDPSKAQAINGLLQAIDGEKLAGAIGNSAQMQAKQLVPAILSDALSENKSLTDAQKQAAVPQLQQNEVPKLVNGAGQVFATDAFRRDAVSMQQKAYSKYYTVQEIKDLTAFYSSPTGKKFIEVQDQVGRDVVNGLMQRYMPQSIQATRATADADIAAISPSAAPSRSTSKSSKK